jgi:hypothetical protein
MYDNIFDTELAAAGFVRDPLSRQGLCYFQRQAPGHYRGIWIDTSIDARTRKANYFVYAVISELNIGYLLKGFCEIRLIQQVANVPGTGRAALPTAQAAQRWADQLVACMEREFGELETSELESLRHRTLEVRTAARKYLTADYPVVGHCRSEEIAERVQLESSLHAIYRQAVEIILSRWQVVEPDLRLDIDDTSWGGPFFNRIQFLVHLLREQKAS